MPHTVTCPACRASLDVSAFAPGNKFACDCGQKMRLPPASGNRTELAYPDDIPVVDEDTEPSGRRRSRDDDDDDDRDRRRGRGRRYRRDERVYCRRCDCRVWTRYRKRMSQTGWILICVGLLFWPLIIVGVFMTEEVEECEDCGRVLDVSGTGFGY